VAVDSEGRDEDQMDSISQGIRTSSRPKRFPNTRSDDCFMGIKSDKAVYKSSTVRAPKHQGYNNVRNIGHNNFTLTSIYDNNINDTQMNNDPRIENAILIHLA